MQSNKVSQNTNDAILSLDDLGIPSDKPTFFAPFDDLMDDQRHLRSIYKQAQNDDYRVRLSIINALMSNKVPVDLARKYGIPLNILLGWCMTWNYGGYRGLESLIIPSNPTIYMLPPQRQILWEIGQDIVLGDEVPRIVELSDVQVRHKRVIRALGNDAISQ